MIIKLNKKVIKLLEELNRISNFNYMTDKQINIFLEINLKEEINNYKEGL